MKIIRGGIYYLMCVNERNTDLVVRYDKDWDFYEISAKHNLLADIERKVTFELYNNGWNQ